MAALPPYVPVLPYPDFAETGHLVRAVTDYLSSVLVGPAGMPAVGEFVDKIKERPAHRFPVAPLSIVQRFDRTFEDAIQSGLTAAVEGTPDGSVDSAEPTRRRPFALVGLEGGEPTRAGANGQTVVQSLPLSVVVCHAGTGRGGDALDADTLDRAGDTVLYALQTRYFRLSDVGGLAYVPAGFEAGAVAGGVTVAFRRFQFRLLRNL